VENVDVTASEGMGSRESTFPLSHAFPPLPSLDDRSREDEVEASGQRAAGQVQVASACYSIYYCSSSNRQQQHNVIHFTRNTTRRRRSDDERHVIARPDPSTPTRTRRLAPPLRTCRPAPVHLAQPQTSLSPVGHQRTTLVYAS
jgi:hypothetical protein